MSDEDKPGETDLAKQRKKSEQTIRRTLNKIEAFGYVDTKWIVSAFASDYIANYTPPEGLELTKTHPIAAFFKWLGDALGLGKSKKVESYRRADTYERPKDMTEKDWLFLVGTAQRLRRLLETVPLPPTLRDIERQAQKRPAPKPNTRRRAPNESAVEALQLKLIAKFMRKSGLEETGFPIRLIGDKGDGGPKLASDDPDDGDKSKVEVTPAPARPRVETAAGVKLKHDDAPKPEDRNKALSVLTGGLLYRFAYDQNKALKWEDTQKVFRATGVYRVYIIPPETGLVERRLLLVSLDKHSAIVRAAEIRKRRGRLVARGGYVVPAAGVNTFVLSSDFSSQDLAEMVEAELSLEARDLVFPTGEDVEAENSASFLQEHQMGFYSLYSRGEGELRGSIMEGPTPAAVVGYRVKPEQIDLREPPDEDEAELPIEAEGPFSYIERRVKRRPAELSILEMDEIEDRRDRMLVAAISQNPAVSIDIG